MRANHPFTRRSLSLRIPSWVGVGIPYVVLALLIALALRLYVLAS